MISTSEMTVIPLLNAVMLVLQLLNLGSKFENKININNLHQILGHFGKASVRLTGKVLGYNAVRALHTCEACSTGKAWKNVNEDNGGTRFQKNSKKQRM
jgi:hypothetical protein